MKSCMHEQVHRLSQTLRRNHRIFHTCLTPKYCLDSEDHNADIVGQFCAEQHDIISLTAFGLVRKLKCPWDLPTSTMSVQRGHPLDARCAEAASGFFVERV
jgi:hypothetical protein